MISPGTGKVALVRPGHHSKTTVFFRTIQKRKNRLGQGRDHLAIATVILALGNDRRPMHMQTGKTTAPAIYSVGVVEPIRATRNFGNNIQDLGNVDQCAENFVALKNI